MQNNGKNATLCPVAFLHRASIREFHLSCSSSSCCSSSSSIPPHVSTLIHWNSIVFSPDRRGPGCSTTRVESPRWSGWSSEARWTCPRRWLGSRWTCRSRTAKYRQGGQQRQGKRTGQSCSTYPKVNLKHIHDSLLLPLHIFHCSKNNTPLVRLFVNDHLFLHHLKLYLQRPTGDLVLKLVHHIFRLNFRK